MSNKLPKQQPNEEVDLGQLFILIGNAFDRLFKFIGKILNWLYLLLIRSLMFIKANFLKITIPITVITLVGAGLDYFATPTYFSTLVVKPNFDSNVQLYDNVSYLDELAKNGDTITLAGILSLSREESAKIRGFEINAVLDDNTKLKFYNGFVQGLDSTRINGDVVDYEKFIENMPETYFTRHIIEVESEAQNFPRSIQEAIVTSVDENNYFDRTKRTISENITLTSAMLQKQLKEVDSLREIYNEVIIAEAKKGNQIPSGGTNISFAEKQLKTNELNLFSETRSINDRLVGLNQRKAELENTITVLSNLKPIGERKFEFFKSKTFYAFLLSAALVLLFMFLNETDKFLENQKKLLSK